MLNAAHRLEDLRTPPGNRLEALKGDLKGLHGIRVNDQWRIVFCWTEGGPAEVRLTDYH
ncbi:MAG: type II toxin-antitoxin system RelE/ParE family toxin [Thermoanaerobaculia bacterium]